MKRSYNLMRKCGEGDYIIKKLTSEGKATVPKKMLKAMKLEPDDYICMTYSLKKIVITKYKSLWEV